MRDWSDMWIYFFSKMWMHRLNRSFLLTGIFVQKRNSITSQFIFFCMKLEHSLNSKLNIKTAVCEVSKSCCKYFTYPSSLTDILWQEWLIESFRRDCRCQFKFFSKNVKELASCSYFWTAEDLFWACSARIKIKIFRKNKPHLTVIF